jgi:hypothetical protein
LFQTILSELQEFAPDLLGQFKPVMKKIYAKHAWQEHGGAPLLGVTGYCLTLPRPQREPGDQERDRVGQQLCSGVNQKIVEEIASSIPAAKNRVWSVGCRLSG